MPQRRRVRVQRTRVSRPTGRRAGFSKFGNTWTNKSGYGYRPFGVKGGYGGQGKVVSNRLKKAQGKKGPRGVGGTRKRKKSGPSVGQYRSGGREGFPI